MRTVVAVVKYESVPPQTLTTTNRDIAGSCENLSIHLTSFVDLDVDVKFAILIHPVESENWLSAAKTAKRLTRPWLHGTLPE